VRSRAASEIRAWGATGFRHDPGRYRDEVMAVIERGLAGVLQPT
jgi:hypothetical protein